VESLGCAKNQVDSELLLTHAKEAGYEVSETPDDADVIVVNSCGFIESAKKESIDVFFSFRNAFPEKKIILAGCLAERYANTLELEEADAIFGNKDVSRIGEVLGKVFDEKRKKQVILTPEYPDPDRERDDRSVYLSGNGSRYLKISEGCNHRCNYCAIPIIRGPLRSRPYGKVIAEAKRLIDEGAYEINVVAQDLGAYGTDWGEGEKFTSLIKEVAEIPGDFVLRMLYIHPDTFPERLIDVVKGSNGKILPYFDIPVQHADHRVLLGMKRTGDREQYVALVKRIREKLPDAVIRTTLMLGFPGEDRAAFEELLKFVDEAELDWMGSFLYSREEGTPAYKARNQREHDKAHKIASVWQKELEDRQTKVTEKRLKRFVGNEYVALIEEEVKGEGLFLGRIYSQAPDVDGCTVIIGEGLKPGDVCLVGIRAVVGFDLEAVLIRKIR